MDQQNYYNASTNQAFGYQDAGLLQRQQQMRAQTSIKTDNVLYVADLPDDVSEEDLYGFFKDYQVKAVKLISVFSRSKAFVTLPSRELAEKARDELNGVKMAAKYSKTKIAKPIRICKFESKQMQETQNSDTNFGRNLLVKNLPKEVSAHQFYRIFRAFGDIRSCKLVVNYRGDSKCYGYVNFYSNDSAEKAKLELVEKGIDGKKIIVVNLQKGLSSSRMKNNIYIKNFPKENFSDEDLKKMFSIFGEIVSAVVVRDQNGSSKGFGFVCFKEANMAEKAYRDYNGRKIFDTPGMPNLYVNYAMKKEERKEHLMRTRLEQLKQDQTMTIVAKIKDEMRINSEDQFRKEIQSVVNDIGIMPKYIRINIVNKTAFLTMHSSKEAESFVQIYSNYQNQFIYFSIYKPRQDRIKTNQYLQKAGLIQKKNQYRQYNQFGDQQVQNSYQPQSESSQQNKGYYKQYNNNLMMGDMNPMMGQFNQAGNRYNTYNNFSSIQQVPQQQPLSNISTPINIPQQQNLQNIPNDATVSAADGEDEEEALAGLIYERVDQTYPQLAGKITGMIKATGIDSMRNLLAKPKDLQNVINEALTMLNKKN